MSANLITRWTLSLGRTFQGLVREGLLVDGPLFPSSAEGVNEEMICEPVAGVEFWFWQETMRLDRIVITLTARISGISVYKGELPEPFAHGMNQAEVREKLGQPYRSMGEVKLPLPIGLTGGWDAYRLASSTHPNAEVVIQYLSDKSVCGLAFRLIDKGHD
ncbi:DUF6392 family protein [Pseudomonas sp. zfem002]|uniref:DUF6392 family protein n=1 Tax=Pseudomonas sp. zfem002 TaxID=3078197 RepID=UPI0029286364|nr:DUF6392 family protein [Pseudomonas sp. zfem002]MDU9390193.1 DUF6392 family protein [Pseudomonas sp. zfem002]